MTESNWVAETLKERVFLTTNMSMKANVIIYTTCMRPVMRYTGETSQITEDMKILWNITGLKDGPANDDIRESCEVQDVIWWMTQRRRQWNNHIKRVVENRIVNITKNNKRGTRSIEQVRGIKKKNREKKKEENKLSEK